MSYIEEHLHPEENVLHVARPTKIVLAPTLILAILLLIAGGLVMQQTGENMILIGAAAVAALLLGSALVKMVVLSSNQYVLTDRRLIKVTGILSKRSTDSHLEKINNVDHRQTLWGRMFGYGDVEVDTASESGMTLFPMIAQPLAFKRAILEASENHRARRMMGVAAPQVSGAQRLRDLKALLDDGLITREEYERKRAALVEEL